MDPQRLVQWMTPEAKAHGFLKKIVGFFLS
jgi:hypothetical protein